MARDFNERVARRPPKAEDLILRNMKAVGIAKELGKLTPNWEGSYLIMHEVRSDTFRLQDVGGRPIQ